ncbi:carboxypeptidase regulatory-like domain-containing protein [Candidatus Kaiserbacteria bacterium]|nr:carboxypeptidase regulatory-like domain-containing protein [Candidatus Kaiserbacteria bacterium]
MRVRMQQRGLSLIELIVASAVITLVFGTLFVSVQYMLELIGTSKAKAGATALAVEELEYIRSLPYNDVGTVSGVPSGAIEPNSTTTLNNITYAQRVLIEYVDDEADGFGGSDENAILADYKRVKVEISWQGRDGTESVSLVSNIVPVGIETTDGGGTIKVNVFDANVLPVSGAEVYFYNDTTTTTISTTRYTNADGVAYLAGAPAAANYEITVTSSGYSTDGTYVATTTNPNPTTPPVAVVESAVSTMNFQIDELSDLTILALGLPTTGSFADSFSDDSLVADYSSTTRSAGAIEIMDNGGVYYSSGTVTSATTSPSTIDSWYAVNFTATTATSTTVTVSVLYDNAGTLELIPDGDLPGNSTGFSGSIDLQSLDVATYGTLALIATLSTTDTDETPYLADWEIVYTETQSPITGVPISVTGAKTIGTDAMAQPVYKNVFSGSTNGSGEYALNDIEFDSYDIELGTGAYDIIEACPIVPVALSPNTDETVVLTLDSAVAAHIHVTVVDPSNDPIANATVRLQNTGVDDTQSTSLCGQTYFAGGLYVEDDYTLTVSSPGYTSEVVSDVHVSATSSLSVSLSL